MDRIKKALDKSRSKKRRSVRQILPVESRVVEEHPFEKIDYTQSRKVDVPPSVLSDNRLIAGNRTDPRAVAFRMLRTQVLHAMRENGWTSIAITGPSPGVGKSMVASNLAISMSLDINQTVLLVDVDLRRPSVHKYFNFEPAQGLLDYLQGAAKIEDLLVNPHFKRLLLLPGRDSTSESSELLSSPHMTKLVEELKTKYQSRVIIFDMPPLLDLDDAIVFMPYVDSTLLVVENGRNTESEVLKSMRLLESTNLIGTVLNKADEEIRDYY